MTIFIQDTDSQSWPVSDLHIYLKELTTSTEGQANAFRLRGETNPARQARDIFSKIKNKCVAEQLDKLLSIIDKIFNVSQQQGGVDFSCIPPMHAHVEEDGSVLLEWVFPDFRIGFNIEPDPDDSGWHLVSGKNLRNKTESGQLIDTPKICSYLYDFIRSNI